MEWSSTPSPSTATPSNEPETLGDRLEHAIEARTDVAGEIERAERAPRRLRKTIFWVVLTGISIYLVFPSLVEVFGSWREITRFSAGYLAAMAGLQLASIACVWALQRLAFQTHRWRPVITSQLAGNALSKIAPGGGAMGAALQYRILVGSGLPPTATLTALSAVNVLVFAVVLAMPVLAIPSLLRGSRQPGADEHGARGPRGVRGRLDRRCRVPLHRPPAGLGRPRASSACATGCAARHARPLHELPERLLRERDTLLCTLGSRWKRALLATVGRWTFDYLTLLAALAAIGSHPRPGLVLLAFCGAQVLAQIPITPGGLGFVEAGLTAMLALAGVSAGDAVLATFAYRLFSYWMPLPLGLVGFALKPRAASAA